MCLIDPPLCFIHDQYLEQTPGDSDFEEALKENEVVVLKKQARSDDLRQAIAELQGCLPQSFLNLSPINNMVGGPSTGPASTPGFPAVASINTDGTPALHLHQTRLEGGHPIPGIRMNMTGPPEGISDSVVQGNMDTEHGHGRPLRQEQVTPTSGAFVRNDRGTASGAGSGLLL